MTSSPHPTHLLCLVLLSFSCKATPRPPLNDDGGAPQSANSPNGRRTPRLLVSGYNSDAIHVFDAQTGIFETNIQPVRGAQSIVRGPDGLLYVCAEKDNAVLRVDPNTLSLLGPIVWDDPETPVDESGGLNGPTAAIFGPDGHLYVASFNTDAILRFDGVRGDFLDVFVASGSGGLNGPDAGMAFGPDGDLYVPSYYTNSILRFSASDGASRGTFIDDSPSQLLRPRSIVFQHGEVFVASSNNNRVLRFDETGAFRGIFARSPRPYALQFDPAGGDLFVANLDAKTVSRHAGSDGRLLDTPVVAGSSGLDGATFLYFHQP